MPWCFNDLLRRWLTKRNEDPEDSKVPFIFVMDNNSIHNAKEVQAYFKSTKVSCMTIAQYWPWLNPWEKLIGAVKQIVSKMKAEGR